MIDHWAGIAGIIVAVQGILALLVAPLLKSRMERKAKLLEAQIARKEKEMQLHLEEDETIRLEYNRRTNNILSFLFSYLYTLLYDLYADRVSIVQPHPTDDQQFISVSHEVVNQKSGVSPQIANFQYRSAADWSDVINLWKKNEFLIYRELNEMSDMRKLFPEASRRGCCAVTFFRLQDIKGNWIGTLVLDYIGEPPAPTHIEAFKNDIRKYGNLIADILPIYEPPKDCQQKTRIF